MSALTRTWQMLSLIKGQRARGEDSQLIEAAVVPSSGDTALQ